MALFLGIDGGGSKTVCAVGDETRLLGSATTGGSNIIRVGEDEARKNLQAGIQQACAAAHVRPFEIAGTCVGMAGASVRTVHDAVRQLVREAVPGEVEVVGDMVIAMESAFAGEPGLIVMAGTGSIAFGRNQRGETARAGGWGFTISDEGSGHWIGRAAVAGVMRARDRGQKTMLEAEILQSWKLSALDEVVRVANTAPDFSALFPRVLEAADQGDALAVEILGDAAAELVQLAGIVVERLWKPDESVRAAMGGNVFRHAELVREKFCTWLQATHPTVAVDLTPAEPVQGALWRARQLAQGKA